MIREERALAARIISVFEKFRLQLIEHFNALKKTQFFRLYIDAEKLYRRPAAARERPALCESVKLDK